MNESSIVIDDANRRAEAFARELSPLTIAINYGFFKSRVCELLQCMHEWFRAWWIQLASLNDCKEIYERESDKSCLIKDRNDEKLENLFGKDKNK